jgi:hypothetical protein
VTPAKARYLAFAMEYSADHGANRAWQRHLRVTATRLRRKAETVERRYNERTADKPPQRWQPRRKRTPAEVVATITGRAAEADLGGGVGSHSGCRITEPLERPDQLVDSLQAPAVWDLLVVDLPPPDALDALVTTLDHAGAPCVPRSARRSLAA